MAIGIVNLIDQIKILIGSAAPSAGNPMPVAGYDGAALQPLKTTPSGVLYQTTDYVTPNTLPVRSFGTTIPATGVLLRSGKGAIVSLQTFNNSGGTLVYMIMDATSQPANGTVPIYQQSQANNAGVVINIGLFPFTTGALLVVSSAIGTYQAIATPSTMVYSINIQ